MRGHGALRVGSMRQELDNTWHPHRAGTSTACLRQPTARCRRNTLGAGCLNLVGSGVDKRGSEPHAAQQDRSPILSQFSLIMRENRFAPHPTPPTQVKLCVVFLMTAWAGRRGTKFAHAYPYERFSTPEAAAMESRKCTRLVARTLPDKSSEHL